MKDPIVDVQVRLHGRAELVARTPELAHRAPDHLAELGELRWSEHDQREDHDEEHFLEADVEHLELHPIAAARGFPAERARVATVWTA